MFSRSSKGRVACCLALSVAFVLLAWVWPGGVAAEVANPPIRVRIGQGLSLVEVKSPSGLTALGPDGEPLLTVPPGDNATLRPAGAAIQVLAPGAPWAAVAGPVRLQATDLDGGPLEFDGRTYRGELIILGPDAAATLTVANVLPLETYLRGVVPKEMPPAWPPEALKAQAVAARTYALKTMQSGKYNHLGFDIDSTTADQAYHGAGAEDPRTDAAIAATAGEVITHGGQLITAFYHSASGGHTESNEVVFAGLPLPYLRGVPDFDQQYRGYRWEVSVTPAELLAALQARGLAAGLRSVAAVEPEPPSGPGGRYRYWVVRGDGDPLRLTGEQLRWVLGLAAAPRAALPQAAADITTGSVTVAAASPPPDAGAAGSGAAPPEAVLFFFAAPQAATRLTVQGAGGATGSIPLAPLTAVARDGRVVTVPYPGVPVLGAAGALSYTPLPPPRQPPPPVPRPAQSGDTPPAAPAPEAPAQGVTGDVPAAFRFTGGGAGHGLGMSQWGARALAEQGRTYVDILTHYYQGVEVGAWAGQ